jgi:hypothetical protein
MFIVVNEFGDAWNGVSWGWNETKRFTSTASAVRALQEAGEDVDEVSIVEDPFVLTEAYAYTA